MNVFLKKTYVSPDNKIVTDIITINWSLAAYVIVWLSEEVIFDRYLPNLIMMNYKNSPMLYC